MVMRKGLRTVGRGIIATHIMFVLRPICVVKRVTRVMKPIKAFGVNNGLVQPWNPTDTTTTTSQDTNGVLCLPHNSLPSIIYADCHH
jgi:hypothetical protein